MGSGTTVSVSPFTSVTRTNSPASIGTSAAACHSSPWTATKPGAPRAIAERACASLTDERVDAGDRRLPLRRKCQATEQQHANREHNHGRQDHAESDMDAGNAASRHQRAEEQADRAPNPERAEAGHLQLEDEEPDAEHNQEQGR